MCLYRAENQSKALLSISRSYASGPDLSGGIGRAGGIGGLAFTFDDFDDQQSNGNTPRAMIPHSDAGGNVTDLLRYTPAMGGNPPTPEALTPVAHYEYGPYGEVRSMTGPQAVLNPIRWSSKFTDAETGVLCDEYQTDPLYYCVTL